MTDNTMREGKLWAFLRDSIHEAYRKLSTTGTSNEYHALLDSTASKVADDVDARFLQAAQSVPVVGEPVAWRYEDPYDGERLSFGPVNDDDTPLFEKPTTSITQAELDAKDARIRELEAAALDVCMAGSYESARLAAIQLNTVLRRPAKEHQS